MSVPVLISVECGPELHEIDGQPALCREASLVIHGVPVFTAIVYDVNRDGDRSEEWAARNLLLTFRTALSKLEVPS